MAFWAGLGYLGIFSVVRRRYVRSNRCSHCIDFYSKFETHSPYFSKFLGAPLQAVILVHKLSPKSSNNWVLKIIHAVFVFNWVRVRINIYKVRTELRTWKILRILYISNYSPSPPLPRTFCVNSLLCCRRRSGVGEKASELQAQVKILVLPHP